jgi:Holliday junction DNA helicase RuvA
MIGRIAGRIDWRGPDQVLIDVHGVGYLVHVSERTLAALPPVGEAAALYTELLVREDLLQLFGFPTMFEREWHRALMTVQGVGAKASMAMLGALGPEGVQRAILMGDARAIQSAPGVGPKLAQRVILELKAKAPVLMAMGGSLAAAPAGGLVEPAAPPGPAPAPAAGRPRGAPRRVAPDPAVEARAQARGDALSALSNLGYGPAEAAQAVTAAAEEAPEAGMAELIRAALRRLGPKG